MKQVEAITTVMVRRRVIATLDEHDHIIAVDQELEDIEEFDMELETIVQEIVHDELEDHREVI